MERYIEYKQSIGNRNVITFASHTGRITVKYVNDEAKDKMAKIAKYIKEKAPNFKYTLRAHVNINSSEVIFKSENDLETFTYIQ
jgi:hypothetical protein